MPSLVPYALILLLIVAVAALLAIRSARRRRRRRLLLARPLSPARRAVLERTFWLYRRLSVPDRRRLEGLVGLFLEEKSFEGCDGLEVTDAMRVTIAAHAAAMGLKRAGAFFPRLSTVLVYPTTFVGERHVEMGSGVSVHMREERAGESWRHGTVVLVWDELDRALQDESARNPAFHEFAHQLDGEDGADNGVPAMASSLRYRVWTRILGQEFRRLRERLEAGERPFLDAYAATNEAEFFAVVAETFFSDPLGLQEEHPRLYHELRLFFGWDPATALDSGAAS